MKRFILVSVVMSVLGQVQSLASMNNYSVTIDNIQYSLYGDTKEAHVYHDYPSTSLSVTNDRLELPETVSYDNQTYTVTDVDCFSTGNTSLELVTPKTVKSVQKVQSGVKKIVLGAGVTSVSDLFESTHLESFEVVEGNEYFSTDNNGILYNKDMTVIISVPYAKHNSFTSFTLPSSVKQIGNDAFREFDKLENITLPEGLETIGVSAFYNCQNLRTCNLPSTIEVIDWCAFYHCPLSNIELPAQLKVIGESAFSSEGIGLASLTIPQYVEKIGDWAFAGWNIQTIYVHCAPIQLSTNQPLGYPQNQTLVVPKGTVDIFSGYEGWKEFHNIIEGDFEPTFNVDDYPVNSELDYDGQEVTINGVVYRLYNSGVAHLYSGWSQTISSDVLSLSIPESVRYRGADYVVEGVDYFDADHVVDLQLPNSIKFVKGVKGGVKTLRLPQSVTSVSDLKQSRDLESFEVAEGNEYFSVDNNGILYNKNKTWLCYAPYGKRNNFTNFTLPSSVESIGDYAFYDFSNLEKVTMPDGLISIGSYAFSYCNKLSNCPLPSTVEVIGKSAFASCALSGLELPAQLKTIGYEAFYSGLQNNYLSSLTIPQYVETIGDYAFLGVTISKVIAHCAPFQLSTKDPLGSPDNQTLVVPKGTRDIFSTRQGWKRINNVIEGDFEPTFNVDDYLIGGSGLDSDGQEVIQNGVTYRLYNSGSAHVYCYYYQPAATQSVLAIPESVYFRAYDYVVDGVEYFRTSDNMIVDLQLPNTIKSISGVKSGVKTLRLPQSVTSVSDLYKSQHLESFEVAEGNEYFSVDNNGILYNKDKSTLYYVPYGKRESFVMFTVPSTVTTIGSYAFYYFDQLAKVILPEGLATIESHAFEYCEILSNCDLPSTVEVIEEYAFSGCKLTNFKLPTQLKSIGNRAFMNGIENYTLSLLYIPPYVESIGNWVFSGITIGTIYSYIMNPMPISENSFGNHDWYPLVVPTGTKEIYSLMPGWRNFTNITESDALLPTAYKCANPEVVRDGNTLTLTSKTDGATIYYTLDGNSPTKNSQVFKDPIILTENCTLKAFAVKESLYESDIVEYPVDWFVCESPEVTEYDGRYFKSTIPEGTTVYYTFNGGEEKQYTNRTAVDGLGTLRLIARHPRKNDSAPYVYEITYFYDGNSTVEVKSEGLLQKAFEWSGTSDVESLTISGSLNTSDINFIKTSLQNVQFLDLENTTIADRTLPEEAFAGMSSLISFSSPKDIINVGGRIFANCPQMAALVWNASESLPSNTFGEQINPNILVYVMSDSWAPSSVRNRIVNGTATRIILSDEESNNNFYCPKAFNTREISYTHNYSMETEIGKCTGWETITLPFTVQKITHETKGELMTFKSYEEAGNPENVRPFWLRALDGNYFEEAATIEAYMPYIISMPNNKKYATPYNLSGNVTFSAENVEIQMTKPIVQHKNSISFVPCYIKKEANSKVMAINKAPTTGDRDAGSVFISNLRDVKPFEAYTTSDVVNFSRVLSLANMMGTTTGIHQILYTGGYSNNDDVKVYNLSGLLVASGKRGEIIKKLPKGVYIINNKKVVVK